MKKTLIALVVIGMVLACSTTVYAGSYTSVFWPADDGSLVTADGGIHKNAHGYVTFRTSRYGCDVTVYLSDAAKSYPYVVKSGGKDIGTLTTNKKGNGQFTFRVTDPSDPDILGEVVAIWTKWVQVSDTVWVHTQLLYAYNPFYVYP
jgi:hypothetical protein